MAMYPKRAKAILSGPENIGSSSDPWMASIRSTAPTGCASPLATTEIEGNSKVLRYLLKISRTYDIVLQSKWRPFSNRRQPNGEALRSNDPSIKDAVNTDESVTGPVYTA